MDEAWNLVAIDEKASQVHFSQKSGTSPYRKCRSSGSGLRQSAPKRPECDRRGRSIWSRARRYGRDGMPWVCVVVEDDGPGIQLDVLPDIFDAFVSSRLDAKGTGLGLTVAQGIIQQHGGSIHASNREGRGARLRWCFPAPKLESRDHVVRANKECRPTRVLKVPAGRFCERVAWPEKRSQTRRIQHRQVIGAIALQR